MWARDNGVGPNSNLYGHQPYHVGTCSSILQKPPLIADFYMLAGCVIDRNGDVNWLINTNEIVHISILKHALPEFCHDFILFIWIKFIESYKINFLLISNTSALFSDLHKNVLKWQTSLYLQLFLNTASIKKLTCFLR